MVRGGVDDLFDAVERRPDRLVVGDVCDVVDIVVALVQQREIVIEMVANRSADCATRTAEQNLHTRGWRVTDKWVRPDDNP